MSELKAGDSFPEGVSFTYVPPSPDTSDITACGIPVKYNASEEIKDKKVVIVAVPGAFTPTCQNQHITGYISKLSELKSKGVDQLIVIAFNDAWVMSAWGKANGIKDDSILFMSDDGNAFSQTLGWTMGARTARYAIVVENGKVVYAEKEPAKGVTVSGADAVLAKL
ncbi:putative peroxisomal membrane protein [Pseudomassariella vexata]|uniref:Thioredoxin peroxidase n=1 Tax=Pseudomassariella vexata TaxID=1141098 RepID=A0A1Y2DMM6_9PEZI|nr:putative peroxisomal membrane protein [Pseudomassariella vexata]ORY60527.1 putative peroxisomal membrane protein [Pseudomassariella vexata]